MLSINNTLYILSGNCSYSLSFAKSINDSYASIGFMPLISDSIVYIEDHHEIIKSIDYIQLKKMHVRIVSGNIIRFIKKSLLLYRKVVLVLLADDELSNLNTVQQINATFCYEKKLEIYCYASSSLSEKIIDQINISNYSKWPYPLRLRRVMAARAIVYHYLEQHSIFKLAEDINGEKWINALIIGCDTYGSEIASALLWCAQMHGYYLRINIISDTAETENHFYYFRPGVKARNNIPRIGEDYYDLCFHNVDDYQSTQLTDLVSSLGKPSVVFVSTPNEQINSDLALNLRSHYSRMEIEEGLCPDHSPSALQRPEIVAVIHSASLARELDSAHLKNYRGQYPHIKSIGNDESVYCPDILSCFGLEEKALAVHLQYSSRKDFEMYEYFRRSSMASAIHYPYRMALIDNPEIRTVTEHRRWCAYMRGTEGYVYGLLRDDLAKTHPSLTAYDNLSHVEKMKDEVLVQNQLLEKEK